MRLIKFLTEDFSHMKETIKKDCSKFLRLKHLLYRGEDERLFSSDFEKIKTRKIRTDKTIFYNEINRWFEKNGFSSRLRNVLFCSGTPNRLDMFGVPRLVFPIGDFNFTYVKAKDMNMDDKSTGWKPEFLSWAIRDELYKLQDDWVKFKELKDENKIVSLDKLHKSSKEKIRITLANGLDRGDFPKMTIDDYLKIEPNIKSYFVYNKNIEEAVKNEWEIWLNCDVYYSVDIKFQKENFWN